MKIADRFQKRQSDWLLLEDLLLRKSRFGRSGLTSSEVIQLSELHRSVCADLMLAEAGALPRETVDYLHALVGRSHNRIYCARRFSLESWLIGVFWSAPRQLRSDPFLAVAALAFLGWFALSALAAASREGFAAAVVGEAALFSYEAMYDAPPTAQNRDDSMRTAFYIRHNTSIGLRCYGLGIFPLVGPISVLVTQGLILGVIFGHMAIVPQAENFYHFVTAHAVFELSAVILCGAGGLRLGWGFLAPGHLTRWDGLRASARQSLPIAGAGAVLFIFAAFVEGYVSPSDLPYSAKVGVAIASALILAAYLLLGGRDQRFWNAVFLRRNPSDDIPG